MAFGSPNLYMEIKSNGNIFQNKALHGKTVELKTVGLQKLVLNQNRSKQTLMISS